MSIETADSNLDVVDPDRPIIDCHHHLWLHKGQRYLIEEFQTDLASGHRVLATVFAECNSMYRIEGSPAMHSVGEAEFVAGMAAMSASGLYGSTQICAGFIGGADLSQGDAVDEVLDALAGASGGRLRGIRASVNWDAEPVDGAGVRPMKPQGLLLDETYRRGIARVAARGLVLDVGLYHPQLSDLGSLADAYQDLSIVVDHCGGLLGAGRYAVPETFDRWKSLITEVARRPNTLMKLGGLAGRRCGFGLERRETAASAQELADMWKPYFDTCIEQFGAERCMFESNFPVDKIAGSYRTVWNAMKLATAGCSPSEKNELFFETARRVYKID